MSNVHQVVFGGPEAVKVWRKGDIGISIQPVNNEESLCFWRMNKADGNGAFVLGVSSLGKYFNSNGFPTPEGVESCQNAIRVMGFSRMDAFALRRLLDAIYEGIDELIKTKPPEPKPAIDLSGVDRLTLRADGDVVSDFRR
jgi:hypothetical protein